jgi:hypothetical protein
MQQAWVLHLAGEHDLTFSSEAQAEAALAKHIAGSWEREMGDRPKPDDPVEMVRDYFDYNATEDATIEETILDEAGDA